MCKTELDALRDCLRHVENTKLISPDDLDLVEQKRILRAHIAALEKADSDDARAA